MIEVFGRSPEEEALMFVRLLEWTTEEIGRPFQHRLDELTARDCELILHAASSTEEIPLDA